MKIGLGHDLNYEPLFNKLNSMYVKKKYIFFFLIVTI